MTFAVASTSFYILFNIIVPIIAIAFYMIFIRIAIAKNGDMYMCATTQVVAIPEPHFLQHPPRSQDIQVHVTKVTRREDFS
ncbi:hypothetical protein F5I97DRAFT_1868243 [Phlebopus sp. FC_14]|nr:hypothetical protein F5I97DRAFT_1868243 [Phlebopus sp. FC_14]